jgi:AcrR family transcriptional regulator
MSIEAPGPSEPPRGYHHGNLRRALLDGARALFAERGRFDFTFRELARAAGVTHAAPYRHFEGKAELFAALCDEGLARLAEATGAALAEAGHDPRARVRALGEAYVGFALAHPTDFRLMMQDELEPGSGKRRGPSYEMLEGALAAAQASGVVRADVPARELAIVAWALVHGLATLVTSGRLPRRADKLARLTDVFATVFFDGAAATEGAEGPSPRAERRGPATGPAREVGRALATEPAPSPARRTRRRGAAPA